MLSRFILHVTLNTGHSRKSGRGEFTDDQLRVLFPLLEAGLDGPPIPIPGRDQFAITGETHGRCYSLWVWRTLRSAPKSPPEPLLSVGIAPHSRCGHHLWWDLHAYSGVKLATSGDQAPHEPWCAILVEPSSALFPEANHWVDQLCRGLAWAWVRRVP